MGSLLSLLRTHWDHESPPHPTSRPPSPPLGGERDGVRRRFMERRNLQNLDANRGHEPDRHHSPCPLPARRGEGGRRPGEGRFMESPLSFFACIGTMNQIGTPLPALSPPGGERVAEGRERGGSRRGIGIIPWSRMKL